MKAWENTQDVQQLGLLSLNFWGNLVPFPFKFYCPVFHRAIQIHGVVWEDIINHFALIASLMDH